MGKGPPIVKAANYLTHLEQDWNSPVWGHWLEELSRDHRLVLYDERGCGLSDRQVEEFSVAAWVQDLEAVVAAVGLDRFALLGLSQGASISVAYAAKHPERVAHLVLIGGYARGRLRRQPTREQIDEAETMLNAMRIGWGRENPAFRQLFSTQLMPEGSADQMRWLNELARLSSTPETAARMERAFYDIEVSDMAVEVAAPALVLHARHDGAVPFEEGRLLGTLIPDARFVPLESRNHILVSHEPAWRVFLDEVRAFLAQPAEAARQPPFGDLTPRELEVLHHIARGLSNQQISELLFVSPKTIRNHITRIFAKLGVARRAEAIVRAREGGLGRAAEPGAAPRD